MKHLTTNRKNYGLKENFSLILNRKFIFICLFLLIYSNSVSASQHIPIIPMDLLGRSESTTVSIFGAVTIFIMLLGLNLAVLVSLVLDKFLRKTFIVFLIAIAVGIIFIVFSSQLSFLADFNFIRYPYLLLRQNLFI